MTHHDQISNFHHDINNSLTLLIGTAEILFEQCPIDHPYYVKIKIIKDAAIECKDSVQLFAKDMNLIPEARDL